MITTLNRADDLRRTLKVVANLRPGPAEVMVTADGCSDTTVAMLEKEFSSVRLFVNEVGIGSVASRAHMMEAAIGDLVLALDDDSHPQQNDCLALLSKWFEDNDRLAIATFPQRSDEYPQSLVESSFGPARSVRSFPNSGGCLRVATYRKLPGFEPIFFHMYEEPDYALQCVANGWDILYLPEICIRHYWTPNQRSELRNHQRHARNELWSTLMRCPFPQAFGLIGYRVAIQARFAAGRGIGWLVREPVWWYAALKGIPRALRRRNSVTWKGYCRWLSLPDA